MFKILFLADISGSLDEGMKNATFHLSKELSKFADIFLISPKKILSNKKICEIKKFSPDIIHYTMGPTLKGLLLLRFILLLNGKAKAIISTPRPQLNRLQTKFLFGFRPNLTLVHSRNHEKYFQSLGFRTLFFPLGVDVNKFKPLENDLMKKKLKNKLKLGKYNKILLHVGQVTKVREVEKLIKVQRGGEYQVVIIAASSIKPDKEIKKKLLTSGIILIEKYIKKLEEYYQIADFFVFPGTQIANFGSSSAIEIPLSVLEAMATGIPVISGKFGGLPDLFNESDCFMFAQNEEEILKKLKLLNTNCRKNREQVLKFSWEELGNKLLGIYSEELNA